jgi:hypothetical protein
VSSSSKWPGVRALGSKHKQGLPNPSTVQSYAEALDCASKDLRARPNSLLTFPACKAPGSDTGHTCDEAGLFASAVESALDPIITELKKRVDWEEISWGGEASRFRSRAVQRVKTRSVPAGLSPPRPSCTYTHAHLRRACKYLRVGLRTSFAKRDRLKGTRVESSVSYKKLFSRCKKSALQDAVESWCMLMLSGIHSISNRSYCYQSSVYNAIQQTNRPKLSMLFVARRQGRS